MERIMDTDALSAGLTELAQSWVWPCSPVTSVWPKISLLDKAEGMVFIQTLSSMDKLIRF